LGAKIGTGVSKNTFVLITKDKDVTTGKVQQARDLGVDIMTVEEFMEGFNL
jgi:NAD-dependent DNA ligase